MLDALTDTREGNAHQGEAEGGSKKRAREFVSHSTIFFFSLLPWLLCSSSVPLVQIFLLWRRWHPSVRLRGEGGRSFEENEGCIIPQKERRQRRARCREYCVWVDNGWLTGVSLGSGASGVAPLTSNISSVEN